MTTIDARRRTRHRPGDGDRPNESRGTSEAGAGSDAARAGLAVTEP